MAQILQRHARTQEPINAINIGNPPTGPTPLPPPATSRTINVRMALKTPPRALLFDVFGTCVDWRTSVTEALEAQAHYALNDAAASLATRVRLRASYMTEATWGEFAQQWRNLYKQFCHAIAEDPSLPWKTIDEHHLESLKELLAQWQLEGLWTDEQVRTLSLIWHQLKPWPDTPAGIKVLNKLFYTGTLSNGNLSLLGDLKVFAQMDFTHLFSAEMFGSYKPSPTVYLGAVEKLGVRPVECAMVAAHLNDLKAAKACGLQTVYVERPLEEDWTAEQVENARKEGWVDLWIPADKEGFIAMAEELGIQVDKTRRRSTSI